MKYLIYLVLLFVPFSAISETYKTNLNNVVIKNPKCKHGSEDYIELTVSNRGSTPVSAKLFITSFDEDKDPIGNGSKSITLAAVSGNKYRVWGVNCINKGALAFRFQ